MKPLIRIIVVLAVIFASTFAIIRLSGVLTEGDIKAWLEAATNINPWYVASAVVLILAIDIFIAVPTLTTCILSGYFLGFLWGGINCFDRSYSSRVNWLLDEQVVRGKDIDNHLPLRRKTGRSQNYFRSVWIGDDYAEPQFAYFFRSMRLHGRDDENVFQQIPFGMVSQWCTVCTHCSLFRLHQQF